MGKLADRVYRFEQKFTAFAILVMGAIVFLDVIHRVASRERGPLATAVGLVIFVVLVQAALRIRRHPPGVKTWAMALGFTAAGYGVLRLFLLVLPNGLVWSQTFGLVLMLWVGLLGASVAARDHRHLALDLGSKLWPKKALPYVQAAGNAITAAFCFIFAALAVVSLRDHFRDYADTDGAGGTFVALPIPKWAAFSVVPVAFTIMGLRFCAQVLDGLRGKVEEDDALHMLGLDEAKPAEGNTEAPRP